MSIPGSTNPLLLFGDPTGGQYQIQRSLRFNASDSAYLSRTPAVAGDRKKWTWAAWAKRSSTVNSKLFYIQTGSAQGGIEWLNTDEIRYFNYGGNYGIVKTTGVFRDFSAWYHIVVTLDAANTSLKIYVNGVEQALTVAAAIINENHNINNTVEHNIGREPTASEYFNGYLADIHFIDGQALTPSSFTEVSATTGQLIPKTYTGTFGTNGFWLKFSDNSAATAATLGKDYSGNSNNWTPNNLSVTAGAGNDSLVDTPTSYGTDTSVGGEVRGNYATLNPLQSSATLSNGNLDCTTTSVSWQANVGTIFQSSGKWYSEVTVTSIGAGGIHIGIVGPNYSVAAGNYIGNTATSYAYRADGTKYNNGSAAAYGATYTTNDVIGIAMDLDAGSLVFYKNGASQGTAYTSMTGEKAFAVSVGSTTGTHSVVFNFGQRAFAYQTPGTNRPAATFLALCDTNLGAPVVAKPNTLMDVVLYTGTGAALTPTSSLGFNPDWIWIKSRSAGTDNALYDVVRGAQARLESNTTDAEVTTDGGVTAFNSAGFTLGTLAQVNTSAATYVAWCWDAGTSTVSNTTGSITSQVRANATAGFSVITYTGTGANATVGHGLGVAPDMVIYRVRSGTSSGWIVYHRTIGGTGGIELQKTSGSFSDSSVFNNTNPTSTVLHVGTNFQTNGSHPLVAYAFAPVVGYSSFGSYVGNGSSDGVFVYTGMRPRWVMIKGSSFGGESWFIWDTSRNTYNQMGARLLANDSLADNSDQVFGDILSNGFKLRNTWGGINGSSNTYIYAAFAESPFQYARAR